MGSESKAAGHKLSYYDESETHLQVTLKLTKEIGI